MHEHPSAHPMCQHMDSCQAVYPFELWCQVDKVLAVVTGSLLVIYVQTKTEQSLYLSLSASAVRRS